MAHRFISQQWPWFHVCYREKVQMVIVTFISPTSLSPQSVSLSTISRLYQKGCPSENKYLTKIAAASFSNMQRNTKKHIKVRANYNCQCAQQRGKQISLNLDKQSTDSSSVCHTTTTTTDTFRLKLTKNQLISLNKLSAKEWVFPSVCCWVLLSKWSPVAPASITTTLDQH